MKETFGDRGYVGSLMKREDNLGEAGPLAHWDPQRTMTLILLLSLHTLSSWNSRFIFASSQSVVWKSSFFVIEAPKVKWGC